VRRAIEDGRHRRDEVDGGVAKRTADLEDSMSRLQLQMLQVQQGVQSLQASNAAVAEDLHNLQAGAKSQAESVCTALEQHLARYLRDEPVKVNFEQPMLKIGALHQSMASDTRTLLREIAKIQQALNVDFLAVLDSRLGEVTDGIESRVDNWSSKLSLAQEELRRQTLQSTPVKYGKRVREFGSQTDRQICEDMSCQTDFAWKRPDTKKTKKAGADRNRLARTSARIPKRPMFADAETMRKKAREALIRPQYNVFDYYHTKGCFQAVAKHAYFDYVTLALIVLNAIWIGVDTELNQASLLIDASAPFQVVENLFCTYFAAELFIRFMAFASKSHCLRDRWFLFDTVLVLLMVVEVWVVSIAVAVGGSGVGTAFSKGAILRVVRVVKLLRVGRVARLLRSVPELLILIKGIKAASRSVGVFFSMWFLVIYVFALVFVQIAEREGDYFNSVPQAMNSLLLDGILPDHARFMKDVSSENWIFWPLTLAFVCLAVLTLMNMLVGVLVEVIGAIAITERESVVVIGLATELREVWETFDLDPEMGITQQEFQKLLIEPEVARIISVAGADVVMLADMSTTIFDDLARDGSQRLRFEALVELVLSMRSMSPAKVKDIREQIKSTRAMLGDTSRKVLREMKEEMAALKDICEARDGSDDDRSESPPPSPRRRRKGNSKASSGARFDSVSEE